MDFHPTNAPFGLRCDCVFAGRHILHDESMWTSCRHELPVNHDLMNDRRSNYCVAKYVNPRPSG